MLKRINYNVYKVSLAILLIGVGSGFFSYILHKLVHKISYFIGTTQVFTVKTYFLSLGLAFISIFLSKKIFPNTHGSGIPQVKLALIALKGKMQKRFSFGKFLTSTLSLATGLSLGKEGPMVSMGAAWAYFVCNVLKTNRSITKVMVSCGASAGLAAAFSTPIAAVVFTIEEILGQFNAKYMGPIIAASVVASVTAVELFHGKTTFLPVHYTFQHKWHLILYFGLGIIMTLVGFIWIKSIIFFKDIRKRYLKNQSYLFIFVAITLMAFITRFDVNLLGDGVGTINFMLTPKTTSFTLTTLAILFIGKFLLSSTAYSTGLSGGLFMPVLFLGASGGVLFGFLLKHLGVADIELGVFTILGMTSLLVVIIRAPFTAFVMLFEMTRDYELILPLMVSSITSYWISSLFLEESVYEYVSHYEGVHLPTISENETLNDLTVEDCMIRNVVSLDTFDSLETAMEKIKDLNYGGFPIIRNHQLVGVISKSDIKAKIDQDESMKRSTIKDVMRKDLITIYPDQSLLIALDKMKRFDVGRLPVISRFTYKKLEGIITAEDIVMYLKSKKQSSIESIDEE